MKKRYLRLFVITLAAALIMMMSLALAGCSGTADTTGSDGEGAGSETEATGETEETEGTEGTEGTEEAVQGDPEISAGALNLLDVHETDTGVGADAVAEVVNTGDVPVVLGTPNIKIADESGKIIVDESGNAIFTSPSYLRPGDRGFIYTSGPVPLPSGYFPGYNYQLQGTADVSTCREVWEYPVSDLSIGAGDDGIPYVSGTVTNDDSEKADLVELTAVYLDNDGNMMGVASEIVTGLEAGASKEFTIYGDLLPVGCTIAIVSDYDVIAVAPKY